MIGTTSSAGTMPTKKSARQPRRRRKSLSPGGICRLVSEPMMLPSADSAWSEPERHGAKCCRHAFRHQRRRGTEHAADAEADEKPVDREIHPRVGETREPRESRSRPSASTTMVFTRPILSLIIPKMIPPVAQPRIIDVVA